MAGRAPEVGHPRGGGLARGHQAPGVDAGGAEAAVDERPPGRRRADRGPGGPPSDRRDRWPGRPGPRSGTGGSAAEATQVRTGLAWALAKDGMVSPLEMLRPGPLTASVAQCRPAVSSTKAPDGSATRKLLS